MQVISASYRTDIPAFYGEWFIRRVREGYVRYKNPYGPQVVTVSFRPQDVHAIVFWSKNYQPFIKYLDEIERYGLDFYFHFAITAQPRILEERVPDWQQSTKTFRALAKRYGPEFVQWRYDPIIFSNLTDHDFHLNAFARLCYELEGHTKRCYFSFLDLYTKVARNLAPLRGQLNVLDPPNNVKKELALELADIASKHGITMYTCAEDFAAIDLIQKGSCIDQDILDQLWPEKAHKLKLSKIRGGCGCYENRDIGAYDTCPHGCVYCYAVLNRKLALKRFHEHDPSKDCLVEIGANVPPADDAPSQMKLL